MVGTKNIKMLSVVNVGDENYIDIAENCQNNDFEASLKL